MSEDDFESQFGDGDVDVSQIALEEMAKIMARLFKAFVKNGLTAQEAAAVTAAYVAQNIPTEQEGPRDGS